jgi:hypothetical protein
MLAAIQLAAIHSYRDAFWVFQESSSELIFQIVRIPEPGNCSGLPDSLSRALRGRMSQLSRRLPGRAVSWRRIVAILP